ncbi:hypothetical protein GCM10009627_26050 [Curtobacterium herbarum]|uniref:Uncharacterized protein n=1 Tax=Curtobacterium herbarum TaxID=150122 RepID=A0ABN1ZEU7_9MICO
MSGSGPPPDPEDADGTPTWATVESTAVVIPPPCLSGLTDSGVRSRPAHAPLAPRDAPLTSAEWSRTVGYTPPERQFVTPRQRTDGVS